MTLLEFADRNQGTALLALVLSCLLTLSVVNLLWFMWSRATRTIMVCLRGWPPEHLDAYGDFRPVDEDDDA